MDWVAEEMQEGKKQALVKEVANTVLEASLKFFDKNVEVGKERLFNVFTWWRFTAVEKGDLLRESVERGRASGIVPYLTKVYDDIYKRGQVRDAEEHASGAWRTATDQGTSLQDGVLGEVFLLWSYGLLFSLSAFLTELVSNRVFVRLVKAVRGMTLFSKW